MSDPSDQLFVRLESEESAVPSTPLPAPSVAALSAIRSPSLSSLKNLRDSFMRSESIHSLMGITSVDPVANTSWAGEPKRKAGARDPAAIERSNLVNICKLVVKELLEHSLHYGRMVDSDHLPLQHFFIVLEHVLRHGLKPKKGLLGPKKELWDMLQCVEKYCYEAQDITTSVRDLPTVRTHIGRARAWLRIALMQKKLVDYLQALMENKDEVLADYYEPHALMMSEEVIVVLGILVGLNVIDCNLCVKGEDLDSQQGVIDFSLYLRSSSLSSPDDDAVLPSAAGAIEGGSGTGNMTAVLDQKNYIEELNRHLNATVGNLQSKVETLTTNNALMKEDLAIARNSLMALQAENLALRQKPNQHSASDGAQPNDAHIHERIDAEMADALVEERKKKYELEKELDIQMSLKAETEMAMKLLEKDIHEKQDTIVSLRRQLDDIKAINLEMYRKLQECEVELTQKGEMVARLQVKASQIGKILQNLENKSKETLSGDGSSNRHHIKSQSVDIGGGPPVKKPHFIDHIPPFNANRVRKSPSADVAAAVAASADTVVTKVDPQECEVSLKHKSDLLTKLESQKETMATAILQLEQKYISEMASLNALRESTQALSLQVNEGEERLAGAETKLRIENEWRVSLQNEELKYKDEISKLQLCVKLLQDEARKHDRVKLELDKVQKQWSEAQTTLEELGIQLSVSKLQVSEMQEKLNSAHTTDASNGRATDTNGGWTPDSMTSKCRGCNREFSMTRRKHHCRNCGEIFCKTCSEQLAPLPNEQGQFGKPVRVCDGCWEIINAPRN